MLCFAIIPVYFGIKAHILGISLTPGANPLLVLIDRTYPSWVVTLVVYGILAAIISTADALLCAISSHIAQDFSLFKTEKTALYYSKIIMLSIGTITLVLGRYFTNIIHIIIGSYAIPVTALIVPLLVAYYKIPASQTGALTSITLRTWRLYLCKSCRNIISTRTWRHRCLNCRLYYWLSYRK